MASVSAEAAIEGLSVLRRSVPAARLDADETVASYKRLSRVERAFRAFKTVNLTVGPIRRRLELRARAQIFLCLLAYYVAWHMHEV